MDEDMLNVTRRGLLKSGATIGAVSLVPSVFTRYAHAQGASSTMPDIEPQMIPIKLKINGVEESLTLDARTTLLDTLRDHLRLTGSKKGCDHGQCGACTILVNNRRVNSCLTLAVMHEGDEIKTIEGLGTPEDLHPMQAAFIEHDGFQCGYCTSGQICSAIGMIAEAKQGMPSHVTKFLDQEAESLSDEEIKERMSGNICRCAAYPNIIAAIKEVEGAA